MSTSVIFYNPTNTKYAKYNTSFYKSAFIRHHIFVAFKLSFELISLTVNCDLCAAKLPVLYISVTGGVVWNNPCSVSLPCLLSLPLSNTKYKCWFSRHSEMQMRCMVRWRLHFKMQETSQIYSLY